MQVKNCAIKLKRKLNIDIPIWDLDFVESIKENKTLHPKVENRESSDLPSQEESGKDLMGQLFVKQPHQPQIVEEPDLDPLLQEITIKHGDGDTGVALGWDIPRDKKIGRVEFNPQRYLAACMVSGKVCCYGSEIGKYAGFKMSGGVLEINPKSDNLSIGMMLGAFMSGGIIVVNAEKAKENVKLDFLGYGMTGGAIVIVGKRISFGSSRAVQGTIYVENSLLDEATEQIKSKRITIKTTKEWVAI